MSGENSHEGIPLGVHILPKSNPTSRTSTPSPWSQPGSFLVSGSSAPRIRRPEREQQVKGSDGRPVSIQAMINGVCWTCSSDLKYPRTAIVYQCPVCETVIDLEVYRDSIDFITADEWDRVLDEVMTEPGDAERDNSIEEKLVEIISKSFASLSALDSSFLKPRSKVPALSTITRFYDLGKTRSKALQSLKRHVEALLRRPRLRGQGTAWLLILIECPLFYSESSPDLDQRFDLLSRFLGIVSNLSNPIHESVVDRLSSASYPTHLLVEKIELLTSFLSSQISQDYFNDWRVTAAAKVLALFFAANVETNRIPTSKFYILAIDSLGPNILVNDLLMWEIHEPHFTLCEHPFLLSLGAKISLLRFDGTRQMDSKAREVLRSNYGSAERPCVYLEIRRSHLVSDSLRLLQENKSQLKKRLQISFVGENGIDAGGLLKEWFLLLAKELFSSDYGMFISDDANLCYFNPAAMEDMEEEFELVGKLLGLAVYNNATLDIPLPLAVFKKLQNEEVTIDDLALIRPEYTRGLEKLLEYDGDIQADFCRTFVGEYESFGEIIQVPLSEGGEIVSVTNENRQDYVDRLVHFHLTSSVLNHFNAFAQGFHEVASGEVLSFFRGDELELLLRGSMEELNVQELRRHAIYEGFQSSDDAAIEMFWRVIESFTPIEQRQWLSFVTASDRLPATGSIGLKICCLGDDEGRFVTVRTCFNQISICRYASYEICRNRIVRSMQESEGFDLR